MAGKRSNGEGVVTYSESRKRWQGRLRFTDAAGVSQRRSVYGRTRAECVAALAALREQVAAGVTPVNRTGGVTVSTFVTSWVDEIAALEIMDGRRAASTVATYATHLRRYVVPVIGTVALARVTTADVRRVMTALGEYRKPDGKPLGTSARRQTLFGMRVLFDAAITDHLMTSNPAHPIAAAAPAHVKGRPHALDAAAIPTLLASLTDAGDRALIATYLGTGARRHEILDLTWDDVDLIAGTLEIGKAKTAAGTGRVVPLAPETVAVLTAWRKGAPARQLAAVRWTDSGHVFTDGTGGALDPRWVTRHVTDLMTAAGTPGGCHTLRHTYITRALEAGASPGAVAAIVGHANPAYMMATYVQTSSADERHAANLIGALLS